MRACIWLKANKRSVHNRKKRLREKRDSLKRPFVDYLSFFPFLIYFSTRDETFPEWEGKPKDLKINYSEGIFLRHDLLWRFLSFYLFCRGLLPTNKVGFPKLVDDKAYMHQLFAIGNVGAVTLLARAYQTLTWADTDFRAKNKV